MDLTNAHDVRMIVIERRGRDENKRSYHVYVKGAERESIPRHKEVKENLAKSIIKRRGLK